MAASVLATAAMAQRCDLLHRCGCAAIMPNGARLASLYKLARREALSFARAHAQCSAVDAALIKTACVALSTPAFNSQPLLAAHVTAAAPRQQEPPCP